MSIDRKTLYDWGVICLCVGLGWGALSCSFKPLAPFTHGFYVWQREWSREVGEGVERASERASCFMPLAGEIEVKDGVLSWHGVGVDWDVLAGSHRPVIPVVRANVRLVDVLGDKDQARGVAEFLGGKLGELAEMCRKAGMACEEVQLDFDAPTSKMGAYAGFLKGLRPLLKTRLSITALPDWLNSPAFGEVAGQVDGFVLQVHSLDKPQNIDAPVALCDPKRALAAAQKAGKYGVPFEVALPTYGYWLAFDASGAFRALGAEEVGNLRVEDERRVRPLLSDPGGMVELVRDLHQARIPGLRGIAWFRLPIATDALNWSWETMAAVLDGRAPTRTYAVEVRSPEAELFEFWISATGEDAPVGRVEFGVTWNNGTLQAYDSINGYEVSVGADVRALRLRGRAPRKDAPLITGWFRMSSATPGFTVQPVEILP